MKVLRDFIHSVDFVHMRPDDSVAQAVPAAGVTTHALVSDRAIAIFLKGGGPGTTLTVQLAAGSWRVEWIDTLTGATAGRTDVKGGGSRSLDPPPHGSDIAVRLLKQ